MARFYSCLHPKTGTSAIVLLLLTSVLIPGGVSSLHAQQSASPADHGPIFSRGPTDSSECLSSNSVVGGDFNGDGKLDWVVTNQCKDFNCFDGSTITARLGNGDGTFRQALISDAGNGAANCVVVGDFNHDGNPDLGVASVCLDLSFSGLLGEVHGMFGNGDGTFNNSYFSAAGGPCPPRGGNRWFQPGRQPAYGRRVLLHRFLWLHGLGECVSRDGGRELSRSFELLIWGRNAPLNQRW